MIFLTETISGLWCGSNIEADNFQEAEKLCPYGFRVIGEFIEEIDAPGLDNFLNLN